MTVYGYTRGTGAAAKAEMECRGCVEIFADDVTSRQMPGPAFKGLVDKFERGDTVLVPSYDKLTRDRDWLDFIVGALRARGVEVETLF